jgi:integral membrane protein
MFLTATLHDPAVAMLRFDSPTSRVRSFALLEGLSYVVLLFIAMPLKYLGGMPLAVRLVGSVHGALFVVLGLLVLRGLTSRGRPVHWGVKIMVASVLPFGTFMIDRRLRAEVDAEREGVPQRG